MRMLTERRTSWGRIERHPHNVGYPRHQDELALMLAKCGSLKRLGVGLGRSYGDSVLNRDGALIDMTGLDRVPAFETEKGALRSEAESTQACAVLVTARAARSPVRRGAAPLASAAVQMTLDTAKFAGYVAAGFSQRRSF